ncbi:hypothetical protein NAF17_17940 [Mucilaginibacter sp. RB4R14]|uniref:hypothetical protein n=1 Tax=Mucilaginibacter aurantiaciroseus TaxID=2949308 RepID=UPI0020908496|nr:hypothetical protein [Mucilaginibacter aurantiaciroseus]MCO5937434.1 hypothetical protein [Mucilaginibacter aurantiaciroseus]
MRASATESFSLFLDTRESSIVKKADFSFSSTSIDQSHFINDRFNIGVYFCEHIIGIHHLGNTCATVTWDAANATQLTPKILQQTDYYAFGLSIKSLEPNVPSPKNQDFYNGKKLLIRPN